MTNLSDKLKSLGVQLGSQNIKAETPQKEATLEDVLSGIEYETINGNTFVVDNRFPNQTTFPHPENHTAPSLNGLARWSKTPQVISLLPEQFCYIDIETTGLSGGTGTFAFLIGAGKYDGDSFLVRQFFLRDPSEEIAQLTALEEFIASCQSIVTYNGKSFDAPIINTRFSINGCQSPLPELIHIDLLHLARRLWPQRLPSRTLGNLEVQVLNIIRTEEDIPGWMIPQIYMDYLYYGDANPLKRVLYHNLQDIVSLAKLFNYAAHLLAEPLTTRLEYGADLIALAKLFEDLGDPHLAADLYFQGLEFEMPEGVMLDAIHRLSLIQKRQENFSEAINLWERASRYRFIDAYIELAKYYEHQVKEYTSAIYWTESAIEIIIENPVGYKTDLLDALTHRLKRLNRLSLK